MFSTQLLAGSTVNVAIKMYSIRLGAWNTWETSDIYDTIGMFNIHRNPSTASDNVPIQPETLPEAAAAEQTSAVPDIFLCCEFSECEERALFHCVDES